jgi:hypothetical protein
VIPSYAIPLFVAALVTGCAKRREAAPTLRSSAPTASASAATTPASAPEKPEGLPDLAIGEGVVSFSSPGSSCRMTRTSMAEYLQRSEVTVAAHDDSIAAAWLVQLPGKPASQIAFGGFDRQGRSVARVRGIGASKDHAPQLFATGSEWTATWFDQDGLTWTRPRWEALPTPSIRHLGAIDAGLAPDVAFGATAKGQLATVAPFGADRAQLGVFLFAPTDPAASAIRAVGVTRSAKHPKRPAIAVKQSGHYLAWLDDDRRIVASFFNEAGKESDVTTVAPTVTSKDPRISVARAPLGVAVLWEDQGVVFVRSLDDAARVRSPIYRVGQGRAAILAETGADPLVAWISTATDDKDKLVVARLSAEGTPPTKGLRLTDLPVRGGPACATADGRLAVVWTESMGRTASPMRAMLGVLDDPCIP